MNIAENDNNFFIASNPRAAPSVNQGDLSVEVAEAALSPVEVAEAALYPVEAAGPVYQAEKYLAA